MSKRVPEWFEEYRKVSDKQREYLAQIQDLRKTFESSAKPLMVSIERQRHLRGRTTEPKSPSLKKMEQKVVLFGPQKFPTRQSFLLEKQNKFSMSPTIVPRSLPPLSRGKIAGTNSDPIRRDPDMETIETVAEINTTLVRGRLSVVPEFKHNSRKVLSISRVSVKEFVAPVLGTSSMEYITNVSSRKSLLTGEAKVKEL